MFPRGALPWRLLRQNPAAFRLSPGRPAPEDEHRREVLGRAAATFAEGFNHVLDSASARELHGRLTLTPQDTRGFAYEGAAMACAVLDILTFSKARRLRALLSGHGQGYLHLIHVGAGWGYARLRLRPWRALPLPDRMLRWLAWDGWGFYQGFFASRRTIEERRAERGLGGLLSLRDQGLGRSLWFHENADVNRVAERIAGFDRTRRGDLWSGVGLAAAYAGATLDSDLELLARLSGPHRAHTVQGIAFAAAAHLRAAHLPDHTRRAALVVAGAPAETLAGWTETALRGLAGESMHSYQVWRSRIRAEWLANTGGD